MKKLIILSAIVLSGLIYNSANAQGGGEIRFTDERGYHVNPRFENRGHREYIQPAYHGYPAPVIDRYRADERFYPGYRRAVDIHFGERR